MEMEKKRTKKEKATKEARGGNFSVHVFCMMSLFSWYSFIVAYDVYCKKILNVFPFPWAVTTSIMGVGVLYSVIKKTLKVNSSPQIKLQDPRNVSAVAVLFTLGQVLNVISLGEANVSYIFSVKALEPLFSLLLTYLILGVKKDCFSSISLAVTTAGCAVASWNPASFCFTSLMNALGGTLALCLRMVYSEDILRTSQIKKKTLDQYNFVGLLTTISFFGLIPFCLLIEGPFLVHGLAKAVSVNGLWNFVKEILICGLVFYLANEGSLKILMTTNALSFAVCNSIQRVITILASMFLFGNGKHFSVLAGSSLTCMGSTSFFYLMSRVKSSEEK